MAHVFRPHAYRALVIGASGGIGSAVADELHSDPYCLELVRLSRRIDGFDVTNEESVAEAAERTSGELHLIFCATGGLTIDGVGPEKSLKQITPDAMMQQFALNALGTALVLKHFSAKLCRQEPAVMAFLSARLGSIGDNRLGGWISYRASKAALNQIVRTASVEIGRTHPKAAVVTLHPGTVATQLTDGYAAGRNRMAPDESARAMLGLLGQLQPNDTGHFFAYDGSSIEW
ncbi:MAG TPA: SDR family NAD(P)-dependent oxidoreductase [Ensifer sp.]|jgi:NAD(P)-dependent dehydrogenase (short-subunit alcohol dehydrogenase family)|uniref:SDR family NAD(P)-dependent oxidoreductase n=1 Tax=Ensifer sp. TaxID=1872086 RepID=UPI002E120CB4|nr:SDR family NAD(P)-dependent oxidoreductase [Ensifer sp.]